ncbi:hypothetical protein FRY74_08380 [Vicingus serpentipes]|uniref:Tissue inhibitor of metalloproteinase n=1 Tax=Vicingus serpentipes TaxID=1926625 RepID=A0A5C6RV61_9FLAO|nr:hypothetical protein [Vicingus serpentipes]TXB65430.1 hypothetical protein FRY74_08380 [Vicingus serpentipes]
MKKLIFLLFLSAFSLEILSCDCKEYETRNELLKDEIDNSDLIFTADYISNDGKSFHLKVKSIYKGTLITNQIIEGYIFDSYSKLINEKGEWLIYANIEKENKININSCGLTRSRKKPSKNNNYRPPSPKLNSKQLKKFNSKRKKTALKDYKKEIDYLEKIITPLENTKTIF